MDVQSPLKFIHSTHGQEQSLRARELQTAEIRAHARRISYRKAKVKKGETPARSSESRVCQRKEGFSGPGDVDLLSVSGSIRDTHVKRRAGLADAQESADSNASSSGKATPVGSDDSEGRITPDLVLRPVATNRDIDRQKSLVAAVKKYTGPESLGADQLIRDKWMNAPLWRWGKSQRLDPFNCIPGSDQEFAQIGLDFREYDQINSSITRLTKWQ
jgi:hypothetical protein